LNVFVVNEKVSKILFLFIYDESYRIGVSLKGFSKKVFGFKKMDKKLLNPDR
jgi:hypothetical protein